MHIYGHPVDLEAVAKITRARGIALVEDCAQSHGARLGHARVGSLGTIAAFSFYPTKNLGALGDGGAVVTNDAALAARVRELREYGWRERYVSASAGMNSRLDELQAAVLRVKLRRLDEDNDLRRALAKRYSEALTDLPVVLPVERPGARHVYHLYVIRIANRDDMIRRLRDRGVGAAIHYPVPIHLQPAYLGRLRGSDRLSETERAATEVMSLPMYPELPDADASTVVTALTTLLQG